MRRMERINIAFVVTTWNKIVGVSLRAITDVWPFSSHGNCSTAVG
jgi:hypothetical protein